MRSTRKRNQIINIEKKYHYPHMAMESMLAVLEHPKLYAPSNFHGLAQKSIHRMVGFSLRILLTRRREIDYQMQRIHLSLKNPEKNHEIDMIKHRINIESCI